MKVIHTGRDRDDRAVCVAERGDDIVIYYKGDERWTYEIKDLIENFPLSSLGVFAKEWKPDNLNLKCECGGGKTCGTHSWWCPIYVKGY